MHSKSAMMTGNVAHPAVIVIEPSPGWMRLNLTELLQYRELVFFLAWRDVKVRYRQTVLGALWPSSARRHDAGFQSVLAACEGAIGGVPYPSSLTRTRTWTLFGQGSFRLDSLVSGATFYARSTSLDS